MRTFAALIVDPQASGNTTANIATLGNVAALKAEIFHQLVKNTRYVLSGEVPVKWRSRRKGEAWQ